MFILKLGTCIDIFILIMNGKQRTDTGRQIAAET